MTLPSNPDLAAAAAEAAERIEAYLHLLATQSRLMRHERVRQAVAARARQAAAPVAFAKAWSAEACGRFQQMRLRQTEARCAAQAASLAAARAERMRRLAEWLPDAESIAADAAAAAADAADAARLAAEAADAARAAESAFYEAASKADEWRNEAACILFGGWAVEPDAVTEGDGEGDVTVSLDAAVAGIVAVASRAIRHMRARA
jgi:hypothetical protein